MEITGTQSIAAPRPAVWDALNDAAVLKRCLPGCESVEKTETGEFRLVVVSAIGPLKARFKGMLRLTETDAPKSCVMVFEGQGGAVGFGKGTAQVELRDAGAATDLHYVAQLQVGGKLAQVGSRLIDSVAKKLSDEFFVAFGELFVPSLAVAAEVPVSAPSSSVGPKDRALSSHNAVWLLAAVVLVIVAYLVWR